MNSASTDVLEALRRLDGDAAELLSNPLDDDALTTLPDDAILALAPLAERLGRRIDALRITIAGQIEARSRPERGEQRLSARAGCASAAELLTRLTRSASSTARERMRLARAVARRTALSGEPLPPPFAAVHDAMQHAELGLDSASAIIRTLETIAPRCAPSDIAAAEQELVEAAIGRSSDGAPACSADDTLLQARVWALALDPDGALPVAERALGRRGLTLGRERDGVVPVRGMLLPDVAAQFRRLSHAHLSPRVGDRTASAVAHLTTGDDDSEETGVRFRRATGDEVDVEESGVRFRRGVATASDPARRDERSHAQRQHDVLATVLGVAARSLDAPTIGGAPPTLLVTIAAGDLDRRDGVAFIEGTGSADEPSTTVLALVARQIACCGGIQRMVLGEAGRIVQLGSPQRVFTAPQRRAIVARDGECVIPGCHVPGDWCEVHHVVEHARGGPTHTDNGLLLCWWHHRSLETSGWQVRMIDGVPHTRAPSWADPAQRWRPAGGSMARRYDRVQGRRQAASPWRESHPPSSAVAR